MLNAKLIAIEVIKEYCKGFMFYDFVFCLHSFAGRFETCPYDHVYDSMNCIILL